MNFDISTFPFIYVQIALSLILLMIYLIGRKVNQKIIKKRAAKYDFETRRIYYTTRVINFAWFLFILTIIAIVWDVSFQGLSIYFASIFTVIGVATVAQWSMISNITAGVILFFNQPYNVGNYIEIIDGPSSVVGTITDIRPFNIQIRTDKGEMVTYPNNLLIQKPIKALHPRVDKETEAGTEVSQTD